MNTVKEYDKVSSTYRIIYQHCPSVSSQQVRAEFPNQVCKVGAKSNGSIHHDDVDNLHHDISQVIHDLPDRAFLTAAGADTETEHNGKYNQRQHVLA